MRMFIRFRVVVIVVWNTTLRYENVNKNIPCLFVGVSAVTVQTLSRVCKLNTNCMHCEYISVNTVDKML